MKNFKKILAIVLVLALAFAFAACSKTTTTSSSSSTDIVEVSTTESTYKGDTIKVGAIAGPTGMGMVKLFGNDTYDMNLITDPTTVPALLTSGDIDIAACPLNMAAALYNKTSGGIRILGLNTLGVLYIVSTNSEVKTLADLEGKTVLSAGEGTTAQYILDYILEKNGLADKVTVEYASEHSEVVSKLSAGKADIVVLPEPYVSIAKNTVSDAEDVISLTDEWTKINPDTELAMGCVITTAKYAEEHADAVNQFIADCKASVEFVNLNAYTSLDSIVENKILPDTVKSTAEKDDDKVSDAKDTVERCNIVYIDGDQMQTIADANFAVYADLDATAIGGKVPASDIYYAPAE